MTIKILMNASIRNLSYMDVLSTLKRIITNQIAAAFFSFCLIILLLCIIKFKQYNRKECETFSYFFLFLE